jgi:vancomycin aglycone glucosyltransferase
VPPDFREWVESLGIPVTPIGPEVRRFAASRPTATQPQVAARSVAEKLGIPYVFAAYARVVMPSPHHAPPPLPPLPGQAPPTTNDNSELWAQNAERRKVLSS